MHSTKTTQYNGKTFTPFAAITWAFSFGLLNVCWALGIGIAKGTIGVALESQDRTPLFLMILCIAGVGKWACGYLAYLFYCGKRNTSWFFYAVLLTGVSITLYALYRFVFTSCILLQKVPIPTELGTKAFYWHVWFWNPIWLFGGLLFLAMAVELRRRTKNKNWWNITT